jgi:hypothetical protein
MDSEENQPNTGRGYNNSPGLGGNLVQEGNEQYENEQGLDQFQQDPNQISPNEKFQPIGSDHSFHLDKKFDNFAKNEKFNQKEKEISDKLDQILQDKTGKSITVLGGYMFLINKILFLTTFSEFLFQRFDIVTLFLSIVVIFIELKIFSEKHLYKWLLVLISTFILDALVILDISPVSNYF